MKSRFENPRKLQAQLGTVEIAVVRRHVFPVVSDDNGASIGQQIDNILTDAAKEAGVVQDVSLHIFPDQLDAVAAFYMEAADIHDKVL